MKDGPDNNWGFHKIWSVKKISKDTFKLKYVSGATAFIATPYQGGWKLENQNSSSIERDYRFKSLYYNSKLTEDGNLHRLDGPAIIAKDEDENCYYINGKPFTKEEFDIFIKVSSEDKRTVAGLIDI